MTKQHADYQSYLLRLWRVSGGLGAQHGGEKPIWRASLQSTLNDERKCFASLDSLFDFLRQQTSPLDATASEDRDA
jgi:hypothetical protein